MEVSLSRTQFRMLMGLLESKQDGAEVVKLAVLHSVYEKLSPIKMEYLEKEDKLPKEDIIDADFLKRNFPDAHRASLVKTPNPVKLKEFFDYFGATQVEVDFTTKEVVFLAEQLKLTEVTSNEQRAVSNVLAIRRAFGVDESTE